MPGAGLKIIERTRPVFTLAPNKLTFTVPAAALAGDLIVALLVHKPGEGFTLPVGWTSVVAAQGATNAQLDVIVRVRDIADSNTLAVALLAVTDEWQGQLIVIRGGAIPTLVEAVGSNAFAADLTPDVPGGMSNQQAMNLALLVVSAAGNIDFAAVTLTQLDEYNTAVVSSRTCFVAWKQTKVASQVFGFSVGTVTANPAATGRTFSLHLRERALVVATKLEDPVPGNIGLLT